MTVLSAPPHKDDFILVKTTRPHIPFPPNEDRQHVYTERLHLRPFIQADLEGLHELRTQPEVMQWTGQGRPDNDLAETQNWLAKFLGEAGQATYNFAITLRSTGELIGAGGCHQPVSSSSGWPEIGYMLKTQHWGKGLATEFLKGLIGAWEALPREEAEQRVEEKSVVRDGEGKARELLVAVTDEKNVKSERILEVKCGFEQWGRWKEEEEQKGGQIGLVGWRFLVGGKEGGVGK